MAVRFPCRFLPVVAFVAVGIGASAASWVAFRHGIEGREAGLPVLGTVPAFSLVASTGQPVSQADLTGQVWIADFIFTQCATLCPTLSAQMAKVQSALAHDGHHTVRLVSFSVDPQNDTPDVLRAYAQRFRADSQRWWFVTGERPALYDLIGQGFHLAVAERPEGANTDGEGLITHSDRFVLIDANLRIRGYYHGTDEEGIAKLLRDVQTLRATEPRT